MLNRPSFVADATIADAITTHWCLMDAEVRYLPWGFGAHHWRATGAGRSVFVTLDQLSPRHTATSLEAAYAAAAALAADGLEVVCAPLPASSGRFTVDVGVGMLSVTPWLAGRTPTASEAREPGHAREVARALAALHAATPPAGLRSWSPRVGANFPNQLRTRASRRWTSGPLAEKARAALVASDAKIVQWTLRYLQLADVAAARRGSWVPTHGEPHADNQIIGAERLQLVDWESVALSPRERDYVDLLDADGGHDLDPDPDMVDLFALDWRMSEIVEYADWFAAPHSGTADDDIALDGLVKELSAPWSRTPTEDA